MCCTVIFEKNKGHRKQKYQHVLEATENGFNYNGEKDKEVSDVLILEKGCHTIFYRNYVSEGKLYRCSKIIYFS
jgi:hypothetical protein